MDPLSIVVAATGLAAQAWKIGSQIYQFIQSAVHVDETLGALAGEVKALGDTCDAIGEIRDIDDSLKASIEAQLERCRAVLTKLGSTLPKATRGGKAVQQMQFNLKQADIDEYRKQIQSILSNLQLSLQLLNLKATYLAPQLANKSLLDELEMIHKLLEDQKLDNALLRDAGRYISEGQTLYAQSVRSESVIGSSLKTRNVADWIHTMQNLHLDHSSASEPSEWQNESSVTTDPELQNGLEDEEFELTIELTDTAQEAGHKAFTDGQYDAAEPWLRQCLQQLQALPEHVRRKYDLDKLHFQLAVCTFHQGDVDSAQTALLSIVERQSVSERDGAQKLEAAMLLAQVYVKMNKLDFAMSTCKGVYHGRRKLLGKDCEACFETLALLQRICRLSSNTDLAALYERLLPDEQRERYCQMFADLRPLADSGDLTVAAAIIAPENVSLTTSPLQDDSPLREELRHESDTVSSSEVDLGASETIPPRADLQSQNDLPLYEELPQKGIRTASSHSNGRICVAGVEVDGANFIRVADALKPIDSWLYKGMIQKPVLSMALASDGVTWAYFMEGESNICIRSIETGLLLGQVPIGKLDGVSKICFTWRDNALLAVHHRRLSIWDWRTGTCSLSVSNYNVFTLGIIHSACVGYTTTNFFGSMKFTVRDLNNGSMRWIWRLDGMSDEAFSLWSWNGTGAQLAQFDPEQIITVYDTSSSVTSRTVLNTIEPSLRLAESPVFSHSEGPKSWLFCDGPHWIVLVHSSSKLLVAYDSRLDKWWRIDFGGMTFDRGQIVIESLEVGFGKIYDVWFVLRLRNAIENCRRKPHKYELHQDHVERGRSLFVR